MDKAQEAKSLGMLVGVSFEDMSRALPAIENRGLPICGHPYAADDEIIDTDIDKLAHHLGCDEEHAIAVKQCHMRLSQEHSGGSWGHCIADLPDYHGTTYHCLRDTFPDHYHRQLTDGEKRSFGPAESPWWRWSEEEIMDLLSGKTVLDACLLIGVEETFGLTGCEHRPTEDRNSAGIVIRSRFIPGGVIGVGWFPSGGCRDQVEFHIDSSWNVSVHPRVGLFGHENGHCNRLPHTFRGQQRHKGVMSYTSKFPYEGFSTGESPYTLPRDPSWAQLERQYGGEPVPVEPGEKPLKVEHEPIRIQLPNHSVELSVDMEQSSEGGTGSGIEVERGTFDIVDGDKRYKFGIIEWADFLKLDK